MPKAVVVGAGVSGLAIAIRLSVLGFDVEVVEAAAHPGGKIHELQKEGFRWDKGPSLFTLPHVLDELTELTGEKKEAYYSYEKLPVITKYFYEDGTKLIAYQDVQKFIQELVDKLDENKEDVLAFFERVKTNYEFTAPIFLENPIRNFKENLQGSFVSNVKRFLSLDMWRSMANKNQRYFKNSKTQQLFNRYATYNGSDPYRAPATLNLIAHLEHQLGAYFLKDGMHSITKALYRLALHQGVQFQFGNKVQTIRVENKKATAVKTANTTIEADIIVSNADVHATCEYLLEDLSGAQVYLNQEKSSSALVFFWGMDKEFQELDLHNIFFSSNYKSEFKSLKEGAVTDDPTVYLYISSKKNDIDAPKGQENWFTMINVPPNTGQDWSAIVKNARKNILAKLNRILKVDVEKHICVEEVMTPIDIERTTSSKNGALYGNASNSKFAAFLRHPNWRSSISNLYFVGGSAHPGGGIPLCLLSAKIVAQEIEKRS